MSLNTILATTPLVSTGYHLKATGTTIGNSLIWDNGTNVGIGNTNTTYKLEVTGTFGVSSTSLLSGNVGIGVAASGAKLQVLGYVNDATLGNISIRTTDNINNTLIFSHSTGFADIRSNEGLKLYVGASFNTLGMTITSAGNVGIGTSSPAQRLVISGSGDQHIEQTSTTAANIYTIYTNTSRQYLAGLSADIGPHSYIIYDATANVARLIITSGGKVNIGTESGPNSTAFNVAGADTSNDLGKFYLNATSSLDKALLRLEKYQNNSTTSQVFVNFTINQQATANGSITANGASQVTFTAWSDRRLKENITELSPQLQNILALKPSEFDYKDGSGHQIGFIAQEMQEVFPDAVGENGQGFLTVAGWNKTEAILVKAIQEMNTKLDEQNQTIQNLQEQINILATK